MFRTILFAIAFAWLATPLASASSSSSDIQGCLAPYNGQDGIACIGVVELDAQDCASFAMYQGQPLQYITDPSQDGTTTFCLVPYGSSCQQSITILSQEGDGSSSASSSSSDIQGCLAPYNGQDGIACIGVVELDAQDCASFAMYQGQPLQYITDPFQDGTTTFCLVPYGSSCQQSITILSQEGDGSFSECNNATSQSAAQLITKALSDGKITVSGSGRATVPREFALTSDFFEYFKSDESLSGTVAGGNPSKPGGSASPRSPSCSTHECLVQKSCTECQTSCQAIEGSIESSGAGTLPENCASNCPCCTSGSLEDC